MRPTHALAAAVLTAGLAAPATAAVFDLGTLAPNTSRNLFTYDLPGGTTTIIIDTYLFSLTETVKVVLTNDLPRFSVIPRSFRDSDGNSLLECGNFAISTCGPIMLGPGSYSIPVSGGTDGPITLSWTITVTPAPAALPLLASAFVILAVTAARRSRRRP
jgi:Ni,Fe-hydrogenase maturation factor